MERIEVACRIRPGAALAAHRSDVLRVAAQHKAQNVRVFGSLARGKDRPESDLDLLVTFAEDASLFDLVDLADSLEGLLGVKVDVVSDAALTPRNRSIRRDAVAV